MLTLRYVLSTAVFCGVLSSSALALAWPGGGADPGQSPAQAAPATGDKQPAPAASPEEIAKLVEQLDADLFGDRQTASEKLAAIGRPALAALAKAAAGESVERTVRTIDLLQKLLESPDESTRTEAKSALETLAKCDRPAVARRAEGVLKAQEAKRNTMFGPNGGQNIVMINAMGGMIKAGPGLKISTRINNGVKETEVEENDQKIKIHDDPKQGISVEITKKKDGKDVTEKFEAKNAEELKKNHPEAHKLYEKYNVQGNVNQMQLRFGPNVRIQLTPAQIVENQARAAKNLAQIAGRQLEALRKSEQFDKLPAEAKEDLKKGIADLKAQISEMEKQLATKPAEEKK